MSTIADNVPPPPEHLSERSQALWRSLVPRQASAPGRLTLLRVALECLDRADEARLALAREGLIKTTEATGAVHAHPLLRIEKEARQQFLSAWGTLGLQYRDSRAAEGKV